MFVINKNGHFFEINSNVEFKIKDFKGCRFFDDEETMLQAVCKDQNLEMDEVAGGTFFITRSERFDKLQLVDDRGFFFDIEESVEDFINEYYI
jgi:hypothetical protein